MNNEHGHSPTRLGNAYFANIKQESIAVFAAVFSSTHSKNYIIN